MMRCLSWISSVTATKQASSPLVINVFFSLLERRDRESETFSSLEFFFFSAKPLNRGAEEEIRGVENVISSKEEWFYKIQPPWKQIERRISVAALHGRRNQPSHYSSRLARLSLSLSLSFSLNSAAFEHLFTLMHIFLYGCCNNELEETCVRAYSSCFFGFCLGLLAWRWHVNSWGR